MHDEVFAGLSGCPLCSILVTISFRTTGSSGPSGIPITNQTFAGAYSTLQICLSPTWGWVPGMKIPDPWVYKFSGDILSLGGLGIHADPADSSLTPQKDWSKSTPMKNNILRHSSPKYCPTHEKGPESPRFPATLNNWASIVFSVLQPRLLEVVWVCVCVSIHGDWTGDPHRVKLLSEKRKKKRKRKPLLFVAFHSKKSKQEQRKKANDYIERKGGIFLTDHIQYEAIDLRTTLADAQQ